MKKKKTKTLKEVNIRLILWYVLMSLGIFSITAISIVSGTYLQPKYSIEVNSISPERFTANIEVVNRLATELKKQEARENEKPRYKKDTDMILEAVSKVESFFASTKNAKELKEKEETLRVIAEALKKQEATTTETSVTETLSSVSEQEKQPSETTAVETINVQIDTTILPLLEETSGFDFFTSENISNIYNNQIPVFLDVDRFNILLALDYEELDLLKENICIIVTDIMEIGVSEEKLSSSIESSKYKIDKLSWNTDVKEIAYSIAASVIQANIFIDEEATQNAISAAEAAVEPVIVRKGEKIVDKDEIITEEIYQILCDLGYVEQNEIDYKMIISLSGLVIIIVLILLFVYVYLKMSNGILLNSFKEKLMVFTLYIISIIVVRLMINLPIVIVPVALLGMLVAVLLDLPFAIIINVIMSIVAVLIRGGDIHTLLYFILYGTFSCLFIKHAYDRKNTVKVAGIIALINGLVIVGTSFLFEQVLDQNILIEVFLGVLSSLIWVILILGSIPFLEIAFDAITPVKLMELTSPDQPILSELVREAPGTYHHSIMVANLAERAAIAIDADAALARAGAYYHDIGKLKCPYYFSENQVGENPHTYLLPLDSARIIIGHVQDGYERSIAEKLPKRVREIIKQHHGNGTVKYFYYKAKKDFPEETIIEDNYKYPHEIPQFREAALVMLADTVEAAVKSLANQGKGMDEIEDMVNRLIKEKLEEGQLEESKLTIKDLTLIKKSFMNVFKGMYHKRVSYPKEEKK